MAAASSIISVFPANLQLDQKGRSRSTLLHQCLQVRAQRFRDEAGRSGKQKIDYEENMRVLRERMEIIRAKERLQRCLFSVDDDDDLDRLLPHDQHRHQRRQQMAGWDNRGGYGYMQSEKRGKKKGKQQDQSDFMELLTVACGTFGATVVGCTLCLCLASIFLQLNP